MPKLGKLPAQRAVHAVDKRAHNLIQPFDLRLGLPGDKAVHGLCHGSQALFHRHGHTAADAVADFRHRMAQEGRAVLLLADGLHVIAQRLLHDKLGKRLVKLIQRLLRRADGCVVEDIKGQRARAARNGGAEGKVHAVDHI